MVHVFIVNPYAGRKNFADNLRDKLKKIDGIEYYIFNSRYPGHETELVRQVREIFDEEKLRIYCCGGSGTLRNAVNGIDDFENIEVASFACGMTNDFLKCFNDAKRFENIEELIYGEVIDIDYIKTSEGNAVNTFSFGLDAKMSKVMEELSPLQVVNKNLPYLLGVLYGMLISRHGKYHIETEFGSFDGTVTEFFFGNGNIIGGAMYFFDKADVRDGLANVRIIKTRQGLFCLPHLIALVKNDQKYLNEHSVYGKSSYVRIKSINDRIFSANHDGEIYSKNSEYEAHVVKCGLHFVVPKGVRLIDE